MRRMSARRVFRPAPVPTARIWSTRSTLRMMNTRGSRTACWSMDRRMSNPRLYQNRDCTSPPPLGTYVLAGASNLTMDAARKCTG